MALSSKALSAIQKAGAALELADGELKNAVARYAQRVTSAMASNPSHQNNNGMFENWKTIARLSKTLESMAKEMGDINLAAASLVTEDVAAPEVLALVAPRIDALAPTDVVAKKKKILKKAGKAATKAGKAVPTPTAAKKKVTKVATKTAEPIKLAANPTKLLNYFERTLNANDFVGIQQSAVSKEIGVPLGSMTAAIKKLAEGGKIVVGPSGTFKLTAAPAA